METLMNQVLVDSYIREILRLNKLFINKLKARHPGIPDIRLSVFDDDLATRTGNTRGCQLTSRSTKFWEHGLYLSETGELLGVTLYVNDGPVGIVGHPIKEVWEPDMLDVVCPALEELAISLLEAT